MKTINVNYKKYIMSAVVALAITASGCNGYVQSNNAPQLFYALFFSTSPVLNLPVISATDSTSITIAQPTLFSSGNPTPTVEAYIGVDGTIIATGSVVTGSTEGPIDVSAGGYTFNGLAGNETYRIFVVAQNSSGYSVATILQNTGGIAPVMNALVTSGVTATEITIDQPTFSTAGNPLPPVQTREAYIGLDGVISVTGSTVNFSTDGPYDVSGGNHQFTGLLQNTSYRIIVVAQNSSGYSVRQIVQSTGGTAPVMNALATSGVDTTNITIDQPTFSTTGNPTPTVRAYIGLAGTISIAGSVVSNYTDGPYDVSGGSHQFTNLLQNTPYRIYVVAQNGIGFDVQTIVQSTGGIAPVMNALATSGVDTTNITIDQPTFSTTGNPTPTVQAYIGLAGTISIAGSVVSNYTDGPYDVSGGSHQFTNLVQNTSYRIYVVAQNGVGFDVQTIVQSTGGIAPVMNALATSGVTTTEITINQPTFSTTGNPTPTVQAYIGLAGTISVAGSVVSNYTDGPYDVSGGSHQFTNLVQNTSYRIYVVAQNGVGFDVQTIVQSTGGAAPVMNALATSGVTTTEITINQPTFSTTGNPTPTVYAYIGLDGTITAAGSVISNYTDGPYDVSGGSHQFTGLLPTTSYRIYVVAKNVVGFDVQTIVQSTGGAAPVMNALGTSGVTQFEITINQPTFSTTGNPTPTVYAYIGLDGTITAAGSVISGYTDGPYDVSGGSHQFTFLTQGTAYRIYVVAKNVVGFDVLSIQQNTNP